MGTMTRTIEVEGGEYQDKASGERIHALCWRRDGDHPLVQRYPIDGRAYKGLLIAGPKDKQAVRFGDWICEDAAGRLYAVSAEAFAERYQATATAVTEEAQ